MKEIEGDDCNREGHQDEAGEINSGFYQSESSDHTNGINDEGDEDPRPAKRQKLSLVHTVKAIMPPCEHSPTPVPTPSLMLSPTIPHEIDEVRSQAEHGYLSTPDDEYYYSPRTSRSPSAVIKSAPFAEYQE